MSSSAYTYAGVPKRSASSNTSQPPISSRPASLSADPSGKTCSSPAMPCCRIVAIIPASMKHPLPARPELGTRDGLAYALFLPPVEPRAGVVICHGAGSAKESHFDFARAAVAYDMAALAFDARGHGGSEGRFGPGAIDDVLTMCGLMREHAARIALRGSSLGGFCALHAAAADGMVDAVVAICPAPEDFLLRGLRAGRLDGFEADREGLEAWLDGLSLT